MFNRSKVWDVTMIPLIKKEPENEYLTTVLMTTFQKKNALCGDVNSEDTDKVYTDSVPPLF